MLLAWPTWRSQDKCGRAYKIQSSEASALIALFFHSVAQVRLKFVKKVAGLLQRARGIILRYELIRWSKSVPLHNRVIDLVLHSHHPQQSESAIKFSVRLSHGNPNFTLCTFRKNQNSKIKVLKHIQVSEQKSVQHLIYKLQPTNADCTLKAQVSLEC